MRSPIDALDFMVRNNGNPGSLPDPGGVLVAIQLDDRGRFDVTIDAGVCTNGAIAPTLEQALLAAHCCDEGETVIVGPDGQPVCRECDPEPQDPTAHEWSCDYCENTRIDRHPPHGWPAEGIPAPVATKPSPLEIVRAALAPLTDEERLDLIRCGNDTGTGPSGKGIDLCVNCGRMPSNRCQCWNDE